MYHIFKTTEHPKTPNVILEIKKFVEFYFHFPITIFEPHENKTIYSSFICILNDDINEFDLLTIKNILNSEDFINFQQHFFSFDLNILSFSIINNGIDNNSYSIVNKNFFDSFLIAVDYNTSQVNEDLSKIYSFLKMKKQLKNF